MCGVYILKTNDPKNGNDCNQSINIMLSTSRVVPLLPNSIHHLWEKF